MRSLEPHRRKDDAPVVGFRRGDANSDGGVDIGDAVTILDVLFGGSPHFCQDAIDTNDDGLTNIADAVYLLSNLFSMGPELPAPTENCGDDPTMDERSCASYDGC